MSEPTGQDYTSTQNSIRPIHNDDRSVRKRVRLLQTPMVFAINDGVSEAERDSTWWRQEDFDETKASVKRMCRGLRKERRFSNSLTDAYEKACGMTFAENPVQAASPAQPESFRISASFADLFDDHGPRGLERLSSRLHAIRRQRHLQEVKHAVFLEQARQNISNRRDADLLARHAEFASRRSRAFASLLGHADAWAARMANLEPADNPPADTTKTAGTDEQTTFPAEEIPQPTPSPSPVSIDEVSEIVEV